MGLLSPSPLDRSLDIKFIFVYFLYNVLKPYKIKLKEKKSTHSLGKQ